jgi:hypothetical protein
MCEECKELTAFQFHSLCVHLLDTYVCEIVNVLHVYFNEMLFEKLS